MLSKGIAKLVQYGVESGLVPECEKNYTTNLLLDVFHEDEYTEPEEKFSGVDLEETLNELLDEAVKRGLIEDSVVYRDLFDTRLMNCLMPRPAQVQKEFWDRYQDDPQKATDYFYKLSQDSNYIRRYRVKKDQKWKVDSPYGEIDITINLSKPEKDPKAIAAAKNAKASSYPKCLLCPENEGYAGRVNHPARQNHRIIPITINDTPWGFQYSPYVYYNEHCIVSAVSYTHLVSSNELAIYGLTQCHKKCAKVYLSLYLERKVNGSYGTYKYWNFTVNNATSLSKTIDVAVPSGTYYRVRGYHAASNDGLKESISTLTSGIMIK